MWTRDFFGWRGKVGLILPAVQTVTEPLFNRISPEGVAFFASRMLVRGNVMQDHVRMEEEAQRAAKELAAAEVDCIAYCCVASSLLRGRDGDRQFCLRTQRETGILTISALAAILEALEELGLKSLVLVSPYSSYMHSVEERFFNGNGFCIVRSGSMEISSGLNYAKVPPGEIYRFCINNWDETADGLFISCMNFNAMPCIQPLEKDLAKPVITAHSATLWKILRTIRVRHPVLGFGELLERHL